jgi:hypothetical protein
MPEAGKGIVLVGMPGSGKSTVGRLLAERLGREFVDTDVLFEERHGTPVPAYLADHGEPAFREAESAVVAEACTREGAVIGVGGGAILDPLNRRPWLAGSSATQSIGPRSGRTPPDACQPSSPSGSRSTGPPTCGLTSPGPPQLWPTS